MASESSAAPEVAAVEQKMFLQHTDNSDAVEVDMTQKQLEKFVELHNHFPSTAKITDKDLEWTNAFFKEMPENEFKELCWNTDYLDSQRFLEAAGDFVMTIMEEMEVKQIQEYLNIVDDYTSEERKAMEEHPLEFFTGVSIQQDEAEQQQAQEVAGAAQ
uniref:Uncharacterized protein n=1 Tax=Panagrolaimus davidi TaxID=227884 RepID=A0A914QGE7_9BILA